MSHLAKLNSAKHNSLRYQEKDLYVISLSGERLDVSGAVWQIGINEKLNWDLMPFKSGLVFEATQLFFRVFLTRSNPTYVSSQFELLKSFFCRADFNGFLVSDAAQYDIRLFEDMRLCLQNIVAPGTVANTLDAYRRWYLWCADANLDGFDEEIATVLEQRIIGGNEKGASVMSDDPNRGPLRPSELNQVTACLRHATEERLMSLPELAAIWLFVSYGTNTKNIALLNDEDLIKTNLSDGTAFYELKIPRIKKGGAQLRGAFKVRSLIPQVGKLLEELIFQNKSREIAVVDDPIKFEATLFRSINPNKSLLATDFAPHAFRWTLQKFHNVLPDFVQLFDLRTSSGEALALSARRLRYSFATRMVQEGASAFELADALDHTDLQNVMVYFNSRSDAVVALDKALTCRLAYTAQALMGLVVLNEQDALRGSDPASRIKFVNLVARKVDDLGSCGSLAVCGLYAPIACYTCFKFQPWLEAPHEAVLLALENDRKAKIKRGANIKLVQIHDATIEAVKKVIDVCNEWRPCVEKETS